MITTNVSGTTTHHARLLNTTNAHTSIGMSLAAFVSGGSHLLWLFRDVPKTLRLFSFPRNCLWCKGTIFHAQCTMIYSFSLSHTEGAEPLSSLSSRISVILFTSLHILQTLKNRIIGSTQMVITTAAPIKYIKTLNVSIISILLDCYLIIICCRLKFSFQFSLYFIF